jgi:complex iron-sulfur molybdoenzyme family reductase subunit alpha
MFLSAEDAAPRGIQDGDTIEVFNDVSTFNVQAAVTPALRPGG